MSSPITNYYLPGRISYLKFINAPVPARGKPKIVGEKEGELLKAIMYVGFADAQKGNFQYHKLLENLQISSMKNEEIISSLLSGFPGSDMIASIDNKMMIDSLAKTRIPESIKMDIICLRLYQRWRIPSL